MEKFKVVKQLGDGAFGSVYMAQNTTTGEIVAVKKMKQKFATWEQCTQLRELKSLAKLNNHLHIVKLKEVIRDQATEELNFVFEYMDSNMHQKIKERDGRPFTEEEVKSLTFQLLSGLAHMHKHGFFHRDLKPENLLMSGNTVKIADFGLARETRSLPPYTEYVSTRWYRAPEVLLKTHNYSSPIDMWAVGTIIAELILLYPLFPGTSEVDQLHKICSILGSPSGDASLNSEGIKLAVSMGFKFPNLTPIPLSEVLSFGGSSHGNATTAVSTEALQLISDLLLFDPNRRLSANESLLHTWF
ncbi:kinase-like domain-containing protein, partial [Obelidium mucronatum]